MRKLTASGDSEERPAGARDRRGARRSLSIAVAIAMGGLLVSCGEGSESRGDAEAAEPGTQLTLAGVTYDVNLSRQLNPRGRFDKALVRDVETPAGTVLLGVFISACNKSGAEARATSRLRLVDAFGDTFKPLGLDRRNVFAYQAERLAAGECIPAEGSAADRAAPGALVASGSRSRRLRRGPSRLNVAAPGGGEGKRVKLDI